MKKYLSLIIISFLFISCSNNEVATPSIVKIQEPSWLLNPPASTKLTAVGCSQIHINGVNGQKKLAISRAVEQIALQKKSQIEVENKRIKKRSNGSTTVSTQSIISSVQTVKTTLSTKVLDSYTDKDKQLCVLVQER